MNRMSVPVNFPQGGGHVRRMSSGSSGGSINIEALNYRGPPQMSQPRMMMMPAANNSMQMAPHNMGPKLELMGTPSTSGASSYNSTPRQSGNASPFTMQLHHAQAMLQSFKPSGTKRKPTDPSDPFSNSGALKLKRKMRKNTREKQRRSELNDKFDQLCDLLQLGGGQTKIEKFTILSEAITVIESLRKENHDLRTDKRELRNELKKMTSVLENAFPANPELAKEFTNRFFPVLSNLSPSESSPSNENRNIMNSPNAASTASPNTSTADDHEDSKSTINSNSHANSSIIADSGKHDNSSESIGGNNTSTTSESTSLSAHSSLNPPSGNASMQKPQSPKSWMDTQANQSNKAMPLSSLPQSALSGNMLSASPVHQFQQQHHRHNRTNSNSSLFGIPSPTQPMSFSFNNFNNGQAQTLPMGNSQIGISQFNNGAHHARKASFPGHERSGSFSKREGFDPSFFINNQQVNSFAGVAGPGYASSNMAISPTANAPTYPSFTFGQSQQMSNMSHNGGMHHPARRPSQEYKISLSSLHGLSPTASPTHARHLSGNAFNFNLNVTLPPYEDSSMLPTVPSLNSLPYDGSYRYANPSPLSHSMMNFSTVGSNDMVNAVPLSNSSRHAVKLEAEQMYGFQSMDEDLIIRDYP